MWPKLRIALVAIWMVFVVAVRRLRRGPRHPTWSFRMELVVSIMRRETDRALRLPLADVRASLQDAPVPWDLRDRVDRIVREVGGVPAEVVTPRDFREESDPTVLYLHGGGYVLCSPGTHRDFVARISATTRTRCVVLDYRLAPEHPFPAALDDAVGAYEALRKETSATQMLFGGDSAGGGLVLATLLRLRDEERELPVGAFAFSPWVDLTLAGDSMLSNAEYDYIQKPVLACYAGHYVGPNEPHPWTSPVNCDFAGVPPLWIHAGGAEILLSENERLVERARAAGVDVTFHVEEGFAHVVPAFSTMVPEGRFAIVALGQWVQQRSIIEALHEEPIPASA